MNNFIRPILYIISLIACCIEIDISVPCFPSLIEYFKTTESLAQHTISINFLGFFIGSLIVGPMSDAYGRRPVMVLGNAILMIGALCCIWVPTIFSLLVARFFQGLGASTSAVVVFAMIADTYKSNKAAQIIGVMNCAFTCLMAISPILGCYLNEIFGWRGNYAVVGIISLLSWILIIFSLPETLNMKKRVSVKQIRNDFYLLLRSGHFLQTSFAPSLLYASYLSFITSAPFLYMHTFKLPLYEYAAHQVIVVVSFAIVSMLSGVILKYMNNFQCILTGITFSIIGTLSFWLGSLIFPNALTTTASVSIFSVGFALLYPVTFTSSLEIFPNIKGSATSLIMSKRAVIIAFVIFMTSYFYDGKSSTVAWIMFCAVSIAGLLMFSYCLKRK